MEGYANRRIAGGRDRFPEEPSKLLFYRQRPLLRNILDIVGGWNAPEVQVTYERNRADPNWSVGPFYTQWLAVSTCGAVSKSTKGWGSKTLDEVPR